MGSYAATAVDLNRDNDFIRVQWFDTQEQVFAQMRRMMDIGWHVATLGLTSEGEDGPVMARPVKVKGSNRYTGIGIWKISDHDADNY